MTAWSAPEQAGHVANAMLADRPLRIVTRPCACGGEITADAADPGEQIRRHNRTLAHLRWWHRQDRETA